MTDVLVRLSRHQRRVLMHLGEARGRGIELAELYDVLWPDLGPRWQVAAQGYRERVGTLPATVRASMARTLSRLGRRGLIVRGSTGRVLLTNLGKALVEQLLEETS